MSLDNNLQFVSWLPVATKSEKFASPKIARTYRRRKKRLLEVIALTA
jgi:hypothetical protein